MACKKSELIAVINSYCSARMTNDPILNQFAAQLLQEKINSLEFTPEEEAAAASEAE